VRTYKNYAVRIFRTNVAKKIVPMVKAMMSEMRTTKPVMAAIHWACIPAIKEVDSSHANVIEAEAYCARWIPPSAPIINIPSGTPKSNLQCKNKIKR